MLFNFQKTNLLKTTKIACEKIVNSLCIWPVYLKHSIDSQQSSSLYPRKILQSSV